MAKKQQKTRSNKRSSPKAEGERRPSKRRTGDGQRSTGAKRRSSSAKPGSSEVKGAARAATQSEEPTKLVPLWAWVVPVVAVVLVWAWQSGEAPEDGKAPDIQAASKASGSPASKAQHEETSQEQQEPESDPGVPAPDDVAEAPAKASRTASGLASVVLKEGKGGDKPGPRDKVQVHYTGWTKDGKMFDSSVTRGEPASFGLNQVIAGWTEGLQLMTVGEKRRLWIPTELAYNNRPGRPAGQLTFDVELLSFEKAPEPPEVPKDVAKPPANAKKTKSGIAYRILKPSTKTKHPSATSEVKVHYSGWTTDGNMFDSSVARGEPTSFALNQVIAGWTEGVQLMVEGQKMRFWIPGKLAYGDEPRPGRPSGMLVFDIELLEIVSGD